MKYIPEDYPIQIFSTDVNGERSRVGDLYFFEEEGFNHWDETAPWGGRRTFEVWVHGEMVWSNAPSSLFMAG